MNHLLESWVALYANHPMLRTGIGFAHIGGLVAGGGSAIAADLATISAGRGGPAGRTTQLLLLKRTHRLVTVGMVALTISGLLLFGADLDTYLYSKVFWLKMGLLALLLVNGLLILRGERLVMRDSPDAWPRLHFTAVCSLVLWFLTTLAGAALPNIG
ncbi:MAG TPA: hypothetical protein VGH34_15145 [Vicinamibacterales bacterium]|jgi:hypothetical protein